MFKVQRVFLDNEHPAAIVLEQELVVAAVEVLEILQLDGLLVVAPPLLEITDKMGH